MTFDGGEGKRLEGYIIEPEIPPTELGRIVLTDGEEYTYDTVSMSVRMGLRNGKISYDDAVFLWEKDSTEVIVARADSYQQV